MDDDDELVVVGVEFFNKTLSNAK